MATIFQVSLRAELGRLARAGLSGAANPDHLRHTFVCRRVMLWHANGTDIDHAMSAPSTYVKVSSILTGDPTGAVAGQRFELFAANAEDVRIQLFDSTHLCDAQPAARLLVREHLTSIAPSASYCRRLPRHVPATAPVRAAMCASCWL